MKKMYLSIILCLLLGQVEAGTDKYRIVITDDPATTITVGWNQISGSNPIVHYDVIDHGTNIANYTYSKSVDRSISYRGMNNRYARLTSLSPNTIYYFLIADSQGVSQRFWFKTSPDDDTPLAFIAGGDSRNNRDVRQDANTLVSKLKPHAVLFGGDMINSDNSTEWQEWFDDWQNTISSDGRMIPIVPARGNHESSSSVYNLFDVPNSDQYYAVTFGDELIRTYTLNSEISTSGNQLTWLTNDLATHSNVRWKTAQYHKPMRPHTASKSEGNSIYNSWAQLFFDNQVRLVIDCDSHTAKTTWPVEPSSGAGNDEGFIRNDANGTVYAGEGCWGAPLRDANDGKNWTRAMGSFNQFKWIWVFPDTIELRTIKIENVNIVGENGNNSPFNTPANLSIWNPSSGAVVIIPHSGGSSGCGPAGTACDDGDPNTILDEQDGLCNCQGIPSDVISLQEEIQQGSDDAEEAESGGSVYITSTDLELVYDGNSNRNNQTVGIRFSSIALPSNAIVYRAFVQFDTDEDTHTEETNLIIKGELSANSEPFTSSGYNITNRPTTSTSVLWSDVPEWENIGDRGLAQKTPDLTAIINEIIDACEWSSSSPLTLIISGTGKRVASSYEDDGDPPQLYVYYKIPCLEPGSLCNDANPSTYMDFIDKECNCVGIPLNGTIQVQVSASEDDAEQSQSGGNISLTSSDLELVYDSYQNRNNQTVGIKFHDIYLPNQSVITNSYIQFTTDEISSGSANATIRGQYDCDVQSFSSNQYNISDRPVTSNSVSWSNIPQWDQVGESGTDQRTPSINSLITEIINHDSWVPGNDMVFLFTGNGKRTAESYNGSQSKAPVLVIKYELCTENNLEITSDLMNATSFRSNADVMINTDILAGYNLNIHHGVNGKVMVPVGVNISQNATINITSDGCVINE